MQAHAQACLDMAAAAPAWGMWHAAWCELSCYYWRHLLNGRDGHSDCRAPTAIKGLQTGCTHTYTHTRTHTHEGSIVWGCLQVELELQLQRKSVAFEVKSRCCLYDATRTLLTSLSKPKGCLADHGNLPLPSLSLTLSHSQPLSRLQSLRPSASAMCDKTYHTVTVASTQSTCVCLYVWGWCLCACVFVCVHVSLLI